MTMKVNITEDSLLIEIPLDENLDELALQELHFQILAEKWKEENKFFSFASEMSKSPYYQRIIAMGKTALPFLLKALQEEPQHWFAALSAITQENPVAPAHRGNIALMTNDWLTWGRMNGII